MAQQNLPFYLGHHGLFLHSIAIFSWRRLATPISLKTWLAVDPSL